MARFSVKNITILSYSLFLMSLGWFGLAIAEIVLESRVRSAFGDFFAQLPGSSLAERIYVQMNPTNIDDGPSVATLSVGALGLVAGLVGAGWMVGLWFDLKMHMVGAISTLYMALSTAANLAVMTFVLVNEGGMKLPQEFSQWRLVRFTREFYVCVAFPSRIPNADDYYGFPVCDHAVAARYNLIALSLVSTSVVMMSCLQVHKSGMFALQRRRDIQSSDGINIGQMNRQGQVPVPTESADEIQASGALNVDQSLYGYYAKK